MKRNMRMTLYRKRELGENLDRQIANERRNMTG